MLKKVRARRARNSIIDYLCPIGLGPSLLLLALPLVVGGIASLSLLDPVPIVLTSVIGLFGLLTIGGMFAVHEIVIEDNELEYLTSLLDRTPALNRERGSLSWSRFKSASVFRSPSDDIVITDTQFGWIVRGRRHDILSAAAAINARREKQALR